MMNNKEIIDELERRIKTNEIIMGFSFVKSIDRQENGIGIFIGLNKKSKDEFSGGNLEKTFIPLSSIQKVGLRKGFLFRNEDKILFSEKTNTKEDEEETDKLIDEIMKNENGNNKN